jgi:hypothetical protein
VLTELDVLKDVASRLERANIDYMLTGSMAMNYYAQPRMTRDIDIVVQVGPEDTERLAALFEPDYYIATESLDQALRLRHMFNVLHLDSVVKVDFIVRKNEPFREKEFVRRRRIELPGFSVWIVSREDLILSKLVWAREAESEVQLRDVRNLLSADADLDYIRDWASPLGVREMLEDLLH